MQSLAVSARKTTPIKNMESVFKHAEKALG